MRVALRRVSFGTAVYGIVVAVVAVGLVVMAVGPWRAGMIMCGTALGACAVARVGIPERSAGLLRVRRRTVDVLWMGSLAALIVTLAIVIPPQPAP